MIAGLLSNAAVAAGDMPDLQRALDAVHAAVHALQAHHHHDDGSIQFDSSPESLHHMDADHFAGIAGVLPATPRVSTLALSFGMVPVGADRPRPEPFLEGLRRPPRPIS